MSSIAGPSSHAFSAFSVHPKQPSKISTKLRRIQDGPDLVTPATASTSPSGAATPLLTSAAPTTAPPTPIIGSSSGAMDLRETSQGPRGAMVDESVQLANGKGEIMKPADESARDSKAVVVTDLESVRARTVELSRKHERGPDDEEVMVQTAVRFASKLAEDHRAALFPNVDDPFTDEVDVVQRLLPFHVFQQPKEDLDVLLRPGSSYACLKGKRKATEEDLLREEIADTKFALECWKRRRALERRFRNARIDSGKRASPADQGYVLAQGVLEIERADNSALSAELRSARAELDKLEREKRAAAPPPTPTTRPTPTIRTTPSSSYYSSTTSTPTTATFMPPYRPPYSYSYSQYPTTQYTYNPHTYSSYTPTTPNAYGASAGQTPTTSTPTTTYTLPSSVSTTAPTSAASAQVQQAAQAQTTAVSNAAIPVQLPVSSRPALAALGIIPVAATSLPPAGQPQPPAVIKSTNGNMLNLEINLSLLQSAQMSGLVLILNALTSRGVNVDGSGGAPSTSTGTAAAFPVTSSTSSGTANGSNGATTATSASSVGSSGPSGVGSNGPTGSDSTSTAGTTPMPPSKP